MSGCWLLIPGETQWTIRRVVQGRVESYSVDVQPCTNAEDVATTVAGRLIDEQYNGEPAMLGLDSSSCFSTELSTNGSQKQSRQSLLYEVEQYLPLAAEEVAADFIRHPDGILGISVSQSSLSRLLQALEERGIRIQSISPVALLALQSCTFSGEQNGRQYVLWEAAEQVELMGIARGKPFTWYSMPARPEAVMRQLHFLAIRAEDRLGLTGYNLRDELRQAVGHASSFSVRDLPQPQDMLHSAATVAEKILSGATSPWIELRRDQLAPQNPFRAVRGLLRVAVVTAMLLLVAMSAVFHFRGAVYAEQADQFEAEQAEIFRSILPGQSIPVGIRSRLESELARTAALRGENAEGLPSRDSALPILYDVLAAMPETIRWRILELRIERDDVFIEGEVRSLSDADVIANSLRSGSFTVEPPQLSRHPEQGVVFRINARWIKETANERADENAES